ncbi:AAA family ATPase [Xinfangfangia sp. CPCC 101601]|uniref:AAA family ATPase n=1 Tax=Pseudogemmobacter lacusdianii TaxID=3069608 RepID=A0ABU0VUF4_9RHOB|nr:AAA family ATPase [Xinfangfangia sp. CPCC 101601]MDQ2065362.1 AAA family ATPase [Xinfangfangia sp. CPCC 101601]
MDPNATPIAPAPLRVCTVSDGIDALLRLAGYITLMPPLAAREDLTLAMALDRLRSLEPGHFDRIVIAPDAEKDASPRLVEAIVAEARLNSPDVVVLLPQKSRMAFAAAPGLTVLFGPPFDLNQPPASSPAAEGETITSPAPRGWWRRFLGRQSPEQGAPAVTAPAEPSLPSSLRLIAVQPLCGGAGATSLAVNLAVEIARADRNRRVCLLDLNLQFGNVATYLGLPTNARVVDIYRSIGAIDADSFDMCLTRSPKAPENLQIFPAPNEILPVDGLSSSNLARIIALARSSADVVILDMPHLVADWSEVAFAEADAVLAVSLLDVRSAQNAARLRELINAETLAKAHLLYLLNRVPRKPSALWEEAQQEFEKAAGTGIYQLLPEAGADPSAAANRGLPLAEYAPSNRLRVEIRDLARDMTRSMAMQSAQA